MIIKKILKKGFSKKILQFFNIKNQSFWSKHGIKLTQTRRKKLLRIYIIKICRLAKYKTINDICSKKISYLIIEQLKRNKKTDSKGKILSANFKTK